MRILVIEDDDKFRNAWVPYLKLRPPGVEAPEIEAPEDLTPLTTCDGIFDAAFDGLTRAFVDRGSRFDLALVDRNLKGRSERDDSSGEPFAIWLHSHLHTPAVLVTAFVPEDARLFDLLRTGSIAGCVNKKFSLPELPKCVDEFKISHRFPNCAARFRWKGGKEESFGEKDWKEVRDGVGDPKLTALDFAVLFRSVIPPCAMEVELARIPSGHGGAKLFRATVSFGDGPVKEEVAIKYGTRALILGEAMRYDRFVGPLPDGVAAQLRWRKETHGLGALAYSWVSDSIEDARPLGPVDTRVAELRVDPAKLDPTSRNSKGGASTVSLNWRRRRLALDKLFSVSLNPWYEIYRKRSDKPPVSTTLLSYYLGGAGYCDHVPFASEPLPENLPSQIAIVKDSGWDFGPLGQRLDPVAWLMQGAGSRLRLERYCPCHGDLHVKNIFVLPDDSPRLIDFGDTALGHVFRDFAALEASVRLTCCNTVDLNDLGKLTDLASSTTALGEHIEYRAFSEDEAHDDLREVLKVIMQIRRAASDAAGDNATKANLIEYLFALSLRLLRYAEGPDGRADEASSKETEQEKAARRWHALYAAACAVEQAERAIV